MARRIPDGMGAIFITGPKWSGKETMAQTLLEALCERRGGRIEAIDTGTLITTFAPDLRDKVGDSVRSCMESGIPINDTLLNRIFYLWLTEECRRNHELKTVIVSGGPRTPVQAKLLEIVDNPLLVILEGSENEMFRIATELGHGENFDHHWKQYTKSVLPVVRGLKQSCVLRVDRSQPLKDRLCHLLHSLNTHPKSPVPKEIVGAAIRRVNDHQHRIHRRIAEIDPPKKQELVEV